MRRRSDLAPGGGGGSETVRVNCWKQSEVVFVGWYFSFDVDLWFWI